MIGHWSLSGKVLNEHLNLGATEPRDNCVVVGAKGQDEDVPLEAHRWLVEHFSHQREFVAEVDSASGRGFCSALRSGRQAFLLNASDTCSDQIRASVATLLNTPLS